MTTQSNPDDLTFTLSINDAQRVAVVAALRGAIAADPTLDNLDDMDGARLLLDMLVDLPDQERASPGCVHGLCL